MQSSKVSVWLWEYLLDKLNHRRIVENSTPEHSADSPVAKTHFYFVSPCGNYEIIDGEYHAIYFNRKTREKELNVSLDRNYTDKTITEEHRLHVPQDIQDIGLSQRGPLMHNDMKHIRQDEEPSVFTQKCMSSRRKASLAWIEIQRESEKESPANTETTPLHLSDSI